MTTYYGTKRVTATAQNNQHGRPGYAVTYPDGYTTWMPKAMFDEIYNTNGSLTYGQALAAMKDGHKVTRAGWNGKDMWIALQVPDAHSKMTLPYTYMKTVTGDLVPWLCSQTDAWAEDWSIVETPSERK
jgi:hypothetical protein